MIYAIKTQTRKQVLDDLGAAVYFYIDAPSETDAEIKLSEQHFSHVSHGDLNDLYRFWIIGKSER